MNSVLPAAEHFRSHDILTNFGSFAQSGRVVPPMLDVRAGVFTRTTGTREPSLTTQPT